MPPPTAANLLETLQALCQYYLPAAERTPLGLGTAVGAVVLGLMLTFRSARVAQGLVSVAGFAVGATVGYQVSLFLQTPAAITAALGGIAAATVAYKTHRWWLGGATVAALIGAALVYQLTVDGNLQRLIPVQQDGSIETGVTLPTAAEQLRELYPQSQERLKAFVDEAVAQMKTWGPRGWLVPAAALCLGILLALWALRVIAVLWIALAGAVVSVLGACSLLGMASPTMHSDLIRRCDLVLAAMAALWFFGLVCQAKAAGLVAGPAAAKSKIKS